MNDNEIVDTLAGFTLFADLSPPQLEAVAHTFDEQWFPEGQRVLRQGFSGTGFYVIIDGEASVRIDGEERARLSKGDFFGELSVLLGEAPVADVVATSPLRCIMLAAAELRGWLLSSPSVTFRMLQTTLRRLRSVSTWQT